MQAFGLTDRGFKAKDLTTIKDELEAELLKEVDPTLHFGAGSIAGILTAIVAHQARQVWEAAHGLYHSLQPNAAFGKALDSLCGLTGTYRKKSALSRIKAMVTLDAGVTLPKDSRIKTIGGHFFKTTSEIKNSNRYKRDSEADLIAEQAGPVIAHANTGTTIMTPVAGWSKAVIKNTYEVGRLAESDDELRLRRIEELTADGSSTADAICARLRRVSQVEAVYIKEAVRSCEVIIKGGSDEDIARTIWQCKPLGVETAGNRSFTITDSIGQSRTIRFSRPEMVNFSLNAGLTVKRSLDQGEIDLIKNSLVDFSVKNFGLGSEVYPARFYSILLAHPQVLNVNNLSLTPRSSSWPNRTNIQPHQIATLSFWDITIENDVEVGE